MQPSTSALGKPHNIPIKISIILLILAAIGFLDSLYLTIEHYSGTIPPCSILTGCETVLTSPYALIFGIPAALLGMLYYAAVGFGLIIFLSTKKTSILRWVSFATIAGFLASAWFVYVQAFVLHAFCTYCLVSAVTSTLLFLGGFWIRRKLSSV